MKERRGGGGECSVTKKTLKNVLDYFKVLLQSKMS